MKKQLVISVMSKDRPGIIADIAGVIFDLGGDLADLNQSVLGGYFSMILIVEFDKKVTPEDLFAGFSHIDSETKIEATIKEMDILLEAQRIQSPKEIFVLTARAENRKGLVKVIGDFFYERHINVLDLETTRDQQQYIMIFQIDLSKILSLSTLREELQEFGEQEDLDIVLQHNDIFTATHEVATPVDTTSTR